MSRWPLVLRLRSSRRLRVGLVVLACWALVAIFADWLAGDLPLFEHGPEGVRALPSLVAHSEDSARACSSTVADGAAAGKGGERSFAVWPLIRHDPRCPSDGPAGAPPSWQHPLGTDGSGRDVAARLIHGARTTIGFAFVVVALALVVGGVLGAFAGQRGGVWDELLARPTELVQAVPQVVVVAVAAAVRPERADWILVAAVAAVRSAEMARLVRGEVMRMSVEPWALGAKAIGCSPRRMLWRHLVPNMLGTVITSTAFSVGSVVVLETAVSFLGFGLPGSWGVLVAEGLTAHASVWATIAGLAAVGTVVGAAHLVGDGAADVVDARVASQRRRIAAARPAPTINRRQRKAA